MQDLGKGLQNPVPRATSAPMTPMAEGRALPSPISANPAVTSAMIATHSRATQGGVAPGATLATKPAPASAQNTQASVFGMVETSIMRQGPDRDFGYVAQRAEDTPVLRFYQSGDTRPVPNAEQVSMAAPAAKSPRQPGPGLILPVSDKVARQADHDRATVSDPLGLSEARPGADTSAVRAGIEGSPTPHRAVEIARQIATQIALPSRSGSGPQAIEITLSPIELGRVRVTLLPGDTTMAVSILADRPETIELMRRHVDVLAQEFRDMGYDGAAFSFDGQGGARGGDAGSPSASDRRDRGPGDDTPLPDNALTTARARIVSDGLDIRL